jgi:2-methylcitrate dehydratase PrpD
MKGKSMEETRHLIQKTRSIKYRDLPDEVIDRAKYFILDYIGFRREHSVFQLHIQAFQKIDQNPGCVVIGQT